MSSIQGLSDWEAHSTLPPPPSAPEAEQEAAEPHAPRPGAPEAQGSWWKRRAGASSRTSGEVGREGSQGGSRAGSPANGEGQASKAKSILGRFGRTQDEDDLPPEWQPRNLDEARPAAKKHEEYVVEDELDDFFGGQAPRRAPARAEARVAQPQARPYDDGFGGLMGAFGAAPKPRRVEVKAKPRVKTAIDPFDPFADEEEQVGSPALAPVAAPLRTASGSSIPRIMSPPLQPVSRPITPLAPPPPPPAIAAPPQVASFAKSPTLVTSHIAAPTAGAAPSADSFDDFFNSVTKPPALRTANIPPPVSAPLGGPFRSAAPALSAPLVPRAFVTPPISPPRRSPLAPATATTTATSGPHRRAPLGAVRAPVVPPPSAPLLAPPPPSVSPVGFVPPPPPPSQPLGKGFGCLPPPPPPPPSGGVGVRSATPPVLGGGAAVGAGVPAAPAAKVQVKKSGGPLDLEDLSFFEG